MSRRRVLGALLIVALAGGAVVLVSGSGAQQPLGPRVLSVTGPRLRVADPLGGAPWRVEQGRRGRFVCVHARRLLQSRPAHRGDGIAFGGCLFQRPGSERVLVDSRWTDGDQPRTLVFGWVRPGVRRVTVTGPGGSHSFELSARGRVFLAVFTGRIAARHFGVGLTMTDGGHKTVPLADASAVAVADPGYGTPWSAGAQRFANGPRRGQTCVNVVREEPRFGPLLRQGATRLVCAGLAGTPFFFKVISVDGRTMLVGAAGPAVTSVEAKAAGETRQVPIAARGRTFLAVFDAAKVHSDDLTVVIHKRTGTDVYSRQRAMNLGVTRRVRPTEFKLSPSEGTMTTTFNLWFRPPEPMDSNLDAYSFKVTGPGGSNCVRRLSWQFGTTWNPRYNARNARRGTAVGFPPRRTVGGSLRPDAWETWCPGTFHGTLRFLDAPKAEGPRGACSSEQVRLGRCQALPRVLARFRFKVRGIVGSFRYQGRTITPDEAAQRKLACSTDRAICADTTAELLSELRRDGIDKPLPGAAQGLCPTVPFEPLTHADVVAIRMAVLDQVPTLYYGTDLRGMRIVKVVHAPRDRDRGGYARVKCGALAWRRTYVVYLDFPAMRPSASLSQGVVLVGRFGGSDRIWARLH